MIISRSCHILVLREQQMRNVSSMHRIMGIRFQTKNTPPNTKATFDTNSCHITVV